MGFYPTHQAAPGTFKAEVFAPYDERTPWNRTAETVMLCSRACLFDYALAKGVNLEHAERPRFLHGLPDYGPHPTELRPDGTRSDYLHVYDEAGHPVFSLNEQPLLELASARGTKADRTCASCDGEVVIERTPYTGKGGTLPSTPAYASR